MKYGLFAFSPKEEMRRLPDRALTRLRLTELHCPGTRLTRNQLNQIMVYGYGFIGLIRSYGSNLFGSQCEIVVHGQFADKRRMLRNNNGTNFHK